MTIKGPYALLHIFLLILFLPLVVHSAGPASSRTASSGSALFNEPLTPAVYELPSGALATWRSFTDHRPTLVLFSAHPLLLPLRGEDLSSVRSQVLTAAPAELVRRGRLLVADPLLSSPQTVSAAIACGLISELIYVQPPTEENLKLTPTAFVQRGFDSGFFSAEEARGMIIENGVIRGKIRGIPFRAVLSESLPQISTPVIVHIDLSYLSSLYVNAIKTPVYPLLRKSIDAIRNAGWSTLGVTLSYSNQELDQPIEDRFMLSILADVAYHPALLSGEVPSSWALRASALYAADMFAENKSQELIAEAVTTNPDDPAAHFDQSIVLFRQKQPDQAFAALDRAVALDPGYAIAYISLAETAMAGGYAMRAEELLRKAASAFPDNPFILISQADLLIRSGRSRQALPLLEKLQKLPWSSYFHGGVPNLLLEMQKAAQTSAAPQP